MKKLTRLDLDDLQVDSFATMDDAPVTRGTVHANADDDTLGAGCVVTILNSNQCETWGAACPSEYYTACTPMTVEARHCAVELPHERMPG